ncbi:MAG: phage portal protein [Eubacteriales bacterium]|jgi:HK97 family phage portal protein
MGLLSRMAVKNLMSLGDLDRMMEEAFSGRPTTAGVKVSESTALNLIEVQKCVRVRAETRGCLPVSVFKRRKNGKGRDEARDHPLYEILNIAPNSEMDSQTFYERMEIYFSLWGNDVSVITRNTSRNKNVTELYPLPWYKMRVKRDENTNKLYYEYWDRGKPEKFPPEKIFHVKGMSFDGLVGISTIGMAREAVAQGLAMSEFANRFFGQGMNMGGILETPNMLSKEARENMRKAAKEMGAGLGHSWEPFLLEEGTKWSRIAMSFVDAQFIEMMNLGKYDIDGLFRVPPHMVANLERSTNNNIEHQGIEFVVYSLLPMITRFERMANWKLLTQRDRAEGFYVKVNVDALLRGDAVSRGQYLNQKRQNGALSADDWRELDDENPTGVKGGDAYLVNGNMISLEAAAGQQPRNSSGGGEKGEN